MSADALLFIEAFPEAAFLLDRRGEILAANNLAHSLVMWPPDSGFVGQLFQTLAQDDRSAVTSALAQWSGSSTPSPARLRIARPDGEVVQRRCDGWRWKGAVGDFVVVRIARDDQTSRLGELTRTIDRLNAECAAHASAEEELRRLIREMNGQNSIRDLVISHVSHDLRTPLNAILGMSEFMIAEPFGKIEPRYLEYLKDIRLSGTALLELVDRVLTLSADANVKDEIVSRLSDLSLCIDNCLRLVEPIARRREIALLIPEAMNLPSLWTDQVLIKQILTNVLGNAVKYVQDGGEVRLDVADAHDGGLRVTISDNGPGIPREKIDRLLETGVRDPFLSKQGSGGIGLYLSCRAMESIGGKMLIDSEVGVGTSISLMLPPQVVERRTRI